MSYKPLSLLSSEPSNESSSNRRHLRSSPVTSMPSQIAASATAEIIADNIETYYGITPGGAMMMKSEATAAQEAITSGNLLLDSQNRNRCS